MKRAEKIVRGFSFRVPLLLCLRHQLCMPTARGDSKNLKSFCVFVFSTTYDEVSK